jgi:hypothetical protein
MWIFCSSSFTAHYSCVTSKLALHIHSYNTGCATWVVLESRQHNSSVDQPFPVLIQFSFILQHFFRHSQNIFFPYSHFSFILIAFFHLWFFHRWSKSSFWTPNY